jgi:nucleoid-associated protein YgaU
MPPVAPAPEAAAGSLSEYVVAKGDSLWKISAKAEVFADGFHWPLIYIANKDRIKDPDLIKPDWKLVIPRDIDASKAAEAVQKAKETPRYAPHTTAREKLPIEY